MDETQLLSVSVNGLEFTFKATKEMIEIMIRFLACLKRNSISAANFGMDAAKKSANAVTKLKYHKISGKTGRKNLNLKAGCSIKGFEISDAQYRFMKKKAKKYGVLFATLPDFRKDGKKHILIPTQQAGLFKELLKGYAGKLEKQAGEEIKEETPEDYINSQGMGSNVIPYERFLEHLTKGMSEEEKNAFKKEMLGNDLRDEETVLENDILDKEEETYSDQETLSMDELENEKSIFEELYEEKEMGELLTEKGVDAQTRRHLDEISEAIKNNELESYVNRPDMTYIEISKERIVPDEKNQDQVLVMDREAGKEKLAICAPKDSFIDFNEKSCLMAASNDKNFASEDGEIYSAREVKKLINNKDENGKNVYSEQFKRIFTLKEAINRGKERQQESAKDSMPLNKENAIPLKTVKGASNKDHVMPASKENVIPFRRRR